MLSADDHGDRDSQNLFDGELGECFSHLYAMKDPLGIIWVPVTVENKTFNF